MKAIIENDQLERIREQAKKVDRLIENASGLDFQLIAQIGFLIGMINATKYTAKKIEDKNIKTDDIPF